MPAFILDGSLTLAWCFEDESTSFTDSIQDALKTDSTCLVAPIWPSEVANGVLIAVRRGRISVAEGDTFLLTLLQMPIDVAFVPPATVFQEVLPLARNNGLTVYDASYLYLAMRHDLPLATLDHALRTAAIKVGVPVLYER
jgi:predicted nucleic acid-binding protein